MPGSASGDCTSTERNRRARSSSRNFPEPGSSRYAMTRGVVVQRADVAPRPCISSLARCAIKRRAAIGEERVERRAHLRRLQERRRRRTRRARRRATASAAQRAERPARPPTAPRSRRARPLRRALRTARAPWPRRAARRPRRRAPRASVSAAVLPHRLEQARQQRAERELVEEDAHLLAVPRAHAEVGRLDVDARRRRTQPRHLPVQEHAVACLAEVLALLRRELVEVLEDALEVPVGGHELGRGLLADAGDAGEVVARVAAERRVLRVLRRRDPGALEDPGFVVERVVGDATPVVEHLDVRVATRAGSCRGRR